MNRLIILLGLSIVAFNAYAQKKVYRGLQYYIESAKEYSPLIKDYRNQKGIEETELDRLKAMLMHSRLELISDYLFVPIISKDGGSSSFRWNAQSASDYYGYDLGESSGYLHGGVTWSQPLLGRCSYKVAEEQAQINIAIANNRILMQEHELVRSVTEQYLLCLLDKAQIEFTDSVGVLIDYQINIIQRLVKNGLAKKADQN